MKHKSLLRNCFDILVFVLFFFAIQAIVQFIAGGVYGYVHKASIAEVVEAMASGKYSQLLAVTAVFSSLLGSFVGYRHYSSYRMAL